MSATVVFGGGGRRPGRGQMSYVFAAVLACGQRPETEGRRSRTDASVTRFTTVAAVATQLSCSADIPTTGAATVAGRKLVVVRRTR